MSVRVLQGPSKACYMKEKSPLFSWNPSLAREEVGNIRSGIREHVSNRINGPRIKPGLREGIMPKCATLSPFYCPVCNLALLYDMPMDIYGQANDGRSIAIEART